MPTAEQRALWAAIRADPLDDTPRLVYADWLQERGDEPRAEFIRVQCALARLPDEGWEGRRARAVLAPRHDALLAAHRGRWVAPYRKVLAGTRAFGDPGDAWLARAPFRRGFLPVFALELDGACRLAGAGDELEPLDEVTVSDVPRGPSCAPRLARVAAWAGAGCVTELLLCGRFAPLGDDAVAAVAAGDFRRLAYLGLYDAAVTDVGVARIANWPGAATLTGLTLCECPVTDAGAFAIADSPHLGGVRSLLLSGNRIGAAGFRRLRERYGTALKL